MKRVYILLMGILCLTQSSIAQDPVFSQFYSNPVYMNPAFAGSHGCPRLTMNYRNQWPSLSGAFVTSTVTYDQYVNVLHGGISVMVMNDMAGQNTINWNAINLAYSYHLTLGRRYSLLFGAQATWNQKFLDWNKLMFGDQIDPHRGFIYRTGDQKQGTLLGNGWGTKGFFDVSVGTVLYSEKFFAGFAAKHLNRPDETLIQGRSRMPIRYTGHMGAKIPFGDKSKYENSFSLSPNVIYSYQDGQQQLNLGTYFNYDGFTAGVWWRAMDAVIMTIGLELPSFAFGYSYDITTSKLTNASGGSHELSMAMKFQCKKRLRGFKTLVCPSF